MSEKAETFLLRKATGLVREAGFWDTVVYNMLPAAPGVVLAFYVFWLPGTFPGSSIPWAMVAACLATLFVSSSFGLLALAMPRTAGDYVATSRILHPAVGLASSLLLSFSSILSVGYWTLAWTTGRLHPGAERGRLHHREPRLDRPGRQAGHPAMELHHRRGGDRRDELHDGSGDAQADALPEHPVHHRHGRAWWSWPWC